MVLVAMFLTIFIVKSVKAETGCTDNGDGTFTCSTPIDTTSPSTITPTNDTLPASTASQGTVYDSCMAGGGGNVATCGLQQCVADGGTQTSCGGYESPGTASQGSVYDSCMIGGGNVATCGLQQCVADGGTQTSCGGYEAAGTASQGAVYDSCMAGGGANANAANCGYTQCLSEPGSTPSSCGGYQSPNAATAAATNNGGATSAAGTSNICGSSGLAVGVYCKNIDGSYGFNVGTGSRGFVIDPVTGASINPTTGGIAPVTPVAAHNVGTTPAVPRNAGATPAARGNAGATPAGGGVQTLSNPLTANSVGDLVKSFAMIFSYIVVLFAVLALVWTGLEFITAQGKPDKLTELKSKLLYIVIGVAIVIGARIIIDVVINTLSASGVVNSQIIQQAKNAVSNQ